MESNQILVSKIKSNQAPVHKIKNNQIPIKMQSGPWRDEFWRVRAPASELREEATPGLCDPRQAAARRACSSSVSRRQEAALCSSGRAGRYYERGRPVGFTEAAREMGGMREGDAREGGAREGAGRVRRGGADLNATREGGARKTGPATFGAVGAGNCGRGRRSF
jgi:hypothetical protein